MSKDNFRRMKEQLSPSERAISELYEKIEQEKGKRASQPKAYKKIIRYTSIAACFVLILAGAGIALNMLQVNTQKAPLVSGAESSKDDVAEESLPQESIDDQMDGDYYVNENSAENQMGEIYNENSTTNQASEIYDDSTGGDGYLGAEFEFNGNNYIIIEKASGYSYGTNLSLKEDCKSIEIKSVASDESIYVDVYEWENVSSEALVAVGKQYTGELDVEMLDPCYLCINKSYSPETLGDFVKDFNINESISFENIRYQKYDGMVASCTNYPVNASDKELYDMLFANLSASSTDEYNKIYESPLSVVDFDISFKGSNIYITLDEMGHLTIRISSVSNRFYIGTDNAQDIFDYVQTHYTDTDNSLVQDSDASGSETSYTEIYNSEPVWDEYLDEYIILE